MLTFYTIADKYLVNELGKYHESYVLNYKGNEFENIGIITEFELSKEQFEESFHVFKLMNLRFCTSINDCNELYKTDTFFFYIFDVKSRNPFGVNIISESEMAKFYGANWESKYIWVICKWVLLEKENTGIS
ncbi:hypothetical protein [Marinigracilibium pacificum]|uniref:Uncharacterized protein n=1 Tax=Marinigracilibium pacificum TaxID=2729599 RepID=A0A848J4V8_9BACT|nr:hypothetical protein [Marinigracilibium pacificum]NMM50811.1 hypothetical protein [Marinigracilibium pacificum]